MRKIILLLLIGYSINPALGQVQGTLSNAKIAFTFVSKKVNGTFAGFSSSSKIDKDHISNSIFKGSVRSETLDTGNFLRNWSLKSGNYFDIKNYPTISFESTAVEKKTDGFIVDGTITIKGVRKPLTITFQEEAGHFVGSAVLYSSDFGIKIIKKSREANKVVLQMSFKVN